MSDCSRRTFVVTCLGASLGAGALALLPACGNSIAPDGTVTVTGGKALLTFSQFPALATVGGGVTVATQNGSPFAVIRTAMTSATALDAVCTHQGCTAVYEQSERDLFCACHGSHFDLTGGVTHGPASAPLTAYPATVGSDGITVLINA